MVGHMTSFLWVINPQLISLQIINTLTIAHTGQLPLIELPPEKLRKIPI